MKMKKAAFKQHLNSVMGFKNTILGAFAFILLGIISVALACTGIGILLLPLFSYSYMALWLNLSRTNKISYGLIFSQAFKQPIKRWLEVLVRSLLISLWSILFVIPGIVMAYAYAMTPYILLDNPDMSNKEARVLSKKMMKGNKWKLFGQDFGLAFASIILVPLTLGLAGFLIPPTRSAIYAVFYDELKKLQNEATAEEAAPAEAAAEAE